MTKEHKPKKEPSAEPIEKTDTAEHSKSAEKLDSAEKITEKAKKKAESFAEKIDATAAELIDKGAKAAKKAEEKTVSVSKSELDSLKKELEEAKDRGLRALAELENFRQRKNREMADDRKYASLDLARDMLPVWDNMGRAIEAAEKDLHSETLIDGVKMMHKQFLDILRKHHIEKIDAVGAPFDPHVHESIAALPSEEPAGTVLVDTQAGFKLHDRVVRPTQVVVAAPKPAK